MNTEIPKGMKIKKLPAGKAYGANDLKNWMGAKGGLRWDGNEFRKQKKRTKKLSKLAGVKVKPWK